MVCVLCVIVQFIIISLNVILMMLLYIVYKSGEDRAPTTVSNNTDQALKEGSSQEKQASQEQVSVSKIVSM